MPKGFKIWILANQGYVLNWLFYLKGLGKGPYNLDMSFIKIDKILKTKTVVLNLLLQEDINTKTRLYPPYKYIVWLNNLFTSVCLL